MKDIQIIPVETTTIAPAIKGKTQVDGLRVYQHVLILLLSNREGLYRQQAGASLVRLLSGANTPPDDLLTSLGVLSCGQVRSQLAPQDRRLLKNISAQAYNGNLFITVQLVDGSSYKGQLT